MTPPVPVLPENAVNLIADGVVLFALDSRETAELLIRTYYRQCAYENIDEDSILLKASLNSSLTTVAADGKAEYLSFEDALNKLLKNRSLVSVQRTVEHVRIESEPIAETIEQTALLPVGARMFRRTGTPSRTLILNELFYKDSLASSDTETLRRQISVGTACTVLIGTYQSAQPDAAATEQEGSIGKSQGSLSFTAPVRGDVIRFFGIDYGTMHYGIDYSANAGSRVTAPEAGTVIFCGERPGYGLVIEIRHENGFVSRIAHCDRAAVELYQHVARGAVIGYLPEEENARTAVLHYELLIDGIPYNPLYYLSR